ncbi:MAG: tubulin-like doman-containing protein [Chloroflexota bacterium]|nr:tubulin-like doman-containing protein [Chloroflexota bacterium]
MSETVKRNFAPQFVGIGGTGCDVISSILQNRDLILPLLRVEGSRTACLALDVANAQIDRLQSTYDKLLGDLKGSNIPRERVSLTAKSVKFPTPEAMFDFIGQYPEHLKKEGVGTPSHYKPWLSSVIEIPPLAGGVGRKRALAKGIYGLNYYLLRLIADCIDSFREQVISSTLQPMIFVIYGMGGGSGSGMVLDFSRHLRKHVGSGVPIIGLCVAPCPGDDPPAKGASAYASLLEHNLVINRSTNDLIRQKFGDAYANPFNAFFMMPLGPAFGQGNGLLYAHQIIDDAIGDTLIRCFNFDPADLLAGIGTNIDAEGRWLHTLSTVKISYPVQEQIDLTKRYLERLDKLRTLRLEKKEIYGGTGVTETGGVRRLLDSCKEDLVSIYKKWLARRGKYDPEKFDEMVRTLIYEDRTVDTDFGVYLKGIHDAVKTQIEELFYSVKAVGLDAVEGTIEARIHKLLMEFYNLVQDLPSRHIELESMLKDVMSGLPDDLATAQLTPRQTLLVRDVMELSDLVHYYLLALRSYLETRKLAEKLQRLLDLSENTEEQQQETAVIRRIVNLELVVLYSLLSSMFSPLSTELKNMDEYLTNCRRMRKLLSDEEKSIDNICDRIDEQRISAQGEATRIERDIAKLKPIISPPGRKKLLKSNLKDIQHRLRMITEEMDDRRAELLAVQDKVKEYTSIEKKFEVNSDYRRLVPEIVEMTEKYYEKLSNMSQDKGFYDRTAELTETEQLQIMQRILKGDEAALSRENILREIIDHDHLQKFMVSVLGLFKSPDTLGLTSEYKTDFLWFTVVAPPGIWNKDMEQDLTSALSGYVEKDVARSVYIRQVESDDPWTIRFLLVAAKAKPQQLHAYQDMKHLYDSSAIGERSLAHSYLLEQGLSIEDDDPTKIALMLDILDKQLKSSEAAVATDS